MCRFINDSLKILWPTGGNDENLRLFLSDTAPNMVKAGDSLKVFYPNIIHVNIILIVSLQARLYFSKNVKYPPPQNKFLVTPLYYSNECQRSTAKIVLFFGV